MNEIFKKNNALIVAFLMVFSAFSFSAMVVLIRYISEEVATTQLVFLRNFLSMLFFLPLIFKKNIASLKTKKLKNHFIRSLIGVVGMELWFYALSIMNVNEATALSFTAPLFATILAVIFLKEVIGIRRIIALLIGFCGSMAIIFNLGVSAEIVQAPIQAYIIMIFAAIFIAITGILIKRLTKTETPLQIVFYMSLFMTIFSAPFGIYDWGSLTLMQFGGIVAIAFFSILAHISMTTAFAKADLIFIMPFDFIRIIFTAIFAYFFIGETLGINVIIGSVLIISSAVYITIRESRSKI